MIAGLSENGIFRGPLTSQVSYNRLSNDLQGFARICKDLQGFATAAVRPGVMALRAKVPPPLVPACWSLVSSLDLRFFVLRRINSGVRHAGGDTHRAAAAPALVFSLIFTSSMVHRTHPQRADYIWYEQALRHGFPQPSASARSYPWCPVSSHVVAPFGSHDHRGSMPFIRYHFNTIC
jgi:hypothetical protein